MKMTPIEQFKIWSWYGLGMTVIFFLCAQYNQGRQMQSDIHTIMLRQDTVMISNRFQFREVNARIDLLESARDPYHIKQHKGFLNKEGTN